MMRHILFSLAVFLLTSAVSAQHIGYLIPAGGKPGETVEILVGETEIENGSAATWEVGENTVTITVEDGDVSKVYTVTVTKTE